MLGSFAPDMSDYIERPMFRERDVHLAVAVVVVVVVVAVAAAACWCRECGMISSPPNPSVLTRFLRNDIRIRHRILSFSSLFSQGHPK